MNRHLKWVFTGLVSGALLLSGTTGLISKTEVASAAAVKPLTVDQLMGKLTTVSKNPKSYYLNSVKKQNLQGEGTPFDNTTKLDIDINRLPKFATSGTFYFSFLDTTFDLYTNDKEFYYLVDGSMLLADDTEEYTVDATEAGEETIDPDGQYWVPMDQHEEWDTLYTKGQFDPASMLDSVKNYKKSMKVTDVGSQTVLQFTVTEPKAAISIIDLYDRELTIDGGTVQAKSVTWKLYVNKKTFQTEKLTVDLNYVLDDSGNKETVATKVEAKYSNHNKVENIVKPSELE